MAKLTYEEYKALEQTGKPGYELFRQLPTEVRNLYYDEWIDSDVLEELIEKHSDAVSHLTGQVLALVEHLFDIDVTKFQR